MSKRRKPRRVYEATGDNMTKVYCTGFNLDEAAVVAQGHFGTVLFKCVDVTSSVNVNNEDACNDFERAREAMVPVVFVPAKDKYQINDAGTKADGFTIVYPKLYQNYI